MKTNKDRSLTSESGEKRIRKNLANCALAGINNLQIYITFNRNIRTFPKSRLRLFCSCKLENREKMAGLPSVKMTVCHSSLKQDPILGWRNRKWLTMMTSPELDFQQNLKHQGVNGQTWQLKKRPLTLMEAQKLVHSQNMY